MAANRRTGAGGELSPVGQVGRSGRPTAPCAPAEERSTGRIAAFRDDDGLADIYRPARQCLGTPYPQRDRRRVSAWIEIDRRHGWGSMKDSSQAG